PDWRMEGAYLKRYLPDKQPSRRPIFIATLWAGASWLFFRVARSTRMTKIWALRSRLEKQPTDLRQNTSYFGDTTLVRKQEKKNVRSPVAKFDHTVNSAFHASGQLPMSVNPSDKGLLTPENCTVIFVDHQPQMFFGVASIDRQV